MNESRFLENCLKMQSMYSGKRKLGDHWESESRRMIQQLKAYPPPKYPLVSTKHYHLDSFAGVCYQPDSHVKRRTLFTKASGRLQRAIRAIFGYGRLGDLLLGPLANDELVRLLLLYSSSNYTTAVTTGFHLFRQVIEDYDLSTTDIFAEQRVLVEGRWLSLQTLRALKQALAIGSLIGTVDTVLEIGAGTGELARLMLLTGKAKRYIVVDIPPALAFSQEVLLSQFGESEIECFDPARSDLGGLSHKRCIFLLPSQTDLLERADVGINVASFQEMTRETVKTYVGLSKAIGVSAFVSINTRQPHPVNAQQEIDEQFYEEAFSPELEAANRYSWRTQSLDVDLKSHDDQYQGYQLLHFVRTA